MVHPAAAAGDEELLDLVDALPEMVLEEAIRGHLGDYNEAGSFVSHGQDTKPCVRPICFISPTNMSKSNCLVF